MQRSKLEPMITSPARANPWNFEAEHLGNLEVED
jgi:hypothetical protein